MRVFGSCPGIALAILAVACSPTSPREAGTVVVFAAASLAPPIEELARELARDGRLTVSVNSAASSTLARQIEAGADADVYVSADREWLDALDEKDLVESASVRVVAENTLVFATTGEPDSNTFETLSELPEEAGAIAVGDPTHVPLGRYARQALEALGEWEAVRPRLVPTLDARAALRLVESGEVAAGIVYASDARTSSRVAIAGTVPCPVPIRYPAALVRREGGASESARELLDLLSGDAGRAILARHGFEVPVR